MIERINLNSKNLSKFIRAGAFALAIGVSASLASGCSPKQEEPASITIDVDHSRSVDVDDINQLNLILCNDDCNQEIFDSVVSKLHKEGVDVLVADSLEDECIKNSMSTVITMDQHSLYSNSTKILGAYNNERQGCDDALALSMEKGLKNQNLKVEGIGLGITSLGQDITKRVPSQTENLVDDSSSFTVVAIGTEISPDSKEQIADGIIDGIARYASIENKSQDLLYRTSGQDCGLDALELHMGTSAYEIRQANPDLKLSEEELLPVDQTIKDPSVLSLEPLNTDQSFKIKQKNPTISIQNAK